ncbi:MAG TPA: glycoside hydrolase family 36 protein [Friedmanniella sp.]
MTITPDAGTAVDTGTSFSWSPGALQLVFVTSPEHPVVLAGIQPGAATTASDTHQPLVELMITGDGRARNTTRFTSTGVGSRLRYSGHQSSASADGQRLRVTQRDPLFGLEVTTTFVASPAVAAVRVTTTVRNAGADAVVLEAVSSFATGALVHADESTHDLVLVSGTGEQLAENRWTVRPLWSQAGLADVSTTTYAARGSVEAVGTSTWSTARLLPTAALDNPVSGRSIAWQIEHNGAWRWEVDNVVSGQDSLALVLLGPEDLDHQWSLELMPGSEFTTVPVSVAVASTGFEGAIAALTAHRRWLRRERTADPTSLLVFNDYMNTINGDPTTERLLPLIAAAGRAGAECFCIDAGWYDDTERGDWWPSVGEWLPSTRRFPGGIGVVLDAIREAGMKVGLWLEPEVVGVRSPVAATLPDAAFLQRHGRRVAEHERYFLDLRHPAARAHLDATFDRLIETDGVDFFKLDYNVTPGPGTDFDAFSVGAGLLEHNRAHLAWFAALRRRHPAVVFENCSSGAMRADFAMLEQFDLQSTSDQEDYRLYPWVAAGAPVQMLPEQAGNWAYPQAWMDPEQTAFTMVTGLSGRLYLSGFLHELPDEQRLLAHDAVAVSKALRDQVAGSSPGWPLGLPQWYDDACALTLSTPGSTLLYVWHRGAADAELVLRLDPSVRAAQLVERYPRRLHAWGVDDRPDGIALTPGIAGPSARVYEISS